MTPEQEARANIDSQLAAAGWIVQDHKAMNLAAGPGIAVREFRLGYRFTDEYPVQHARKNAIEPAAKVVITPIQRLYSILKGEPEYAEENEEQSMFESGHALHKEPLPVVYNSALPIETFDCIVVDECHRSIYNVWRQVLEYFDATR